MIGRNVRCKRIRRILAVLCRYQSSFGIQAPEPALHQPSMCWGNTVLADESLRSDGIVPALEATKIFKRCKDECRGPVIQRIHALCDPSCWQLDRNQRGLIGGGE